ncbi:MAG TPA: glutathione S-transferase family protein [Dongiaceae bacterium]|jgi:glutathione S-transferase|nr:glutathione S-transferase family protein [Dongiaceae bacterium]
MTRILYIGNKNYSSWSLRPFLALRMANVDFQEKMIPLRRDTTGPALAKISPTGKVPVLVKDDLCIWDSLAICEYAAELAPSLWPAPRSVRAQARAAAAEMHSGFTSLRTFLPMDIHGRHAPFGDASQDIARVQALWERALDGSGGPFLFGAFSVADAMFAPVVTRFRTYGIQTNGNVARYMAGILALPPFLEWEQAAKLETRDFALAPA